MARISVATKLANQHKQEAIEEILASQKKSLSPTGLVVGSLDSAFDEVAGLESNDDDLVVPSTTASWSTSSEPQVVESPIVDIVPPSKSQESEETYGSVQQGPTQEEEEELRRTVQALFELEETLLNQHMSNIQVSLKGKTIIDFQQTVLSLT